MASGSRHVWRWSDEAPEAIVPLILIIVVLLAVPFGHCGPDASQGEPRSVTRFGAVELPEPAPAPPVIEAPAEVDGAADGAPAEVAPTE